MSNALASKRFATEEETGMTLFVVDVSMCQ